MSSRVRFHCRRTDLFQRKKIHSRPHTLQAVQGQARPAAPKAASRSARHLRRVRHRNYGPIQAPPGQASAVPPVLSDKQVSSNSGRYAAHPLAARNRRVPGAFGFDFETWESTAPPTYPAPAENLTLPLMPDEGQKTCDFDHFRRARMPIKSYLCVPSAGKPGRERGSQRPRGSACIPI